MNLLLLAFTLAQAEPPPFELQVNHAIATGVEWLRREQKPDGSWGDLEGEHRGGWTSLALYTLRKSGVPPGDDSFRRGIQALLTIGPTQSTYAASVHLLLCESINQPATWAPRAQTSLDVLIRGQRDGLWGYPHDPIDLSNSAFALLGLRAAAALGLAVPETTLTAAAQAIWRHQRSDRGFAYGPDGDSTASITAAALGGLAILQDFADADPGLRQLDIVLRKRARDHEAAIAWFENAFTLEHNRHGRWRWTPSWQYPHLWSVERWAGFTGRGQIGGADWYRLGAEWLLARQHPDGQWESRENTCFALLFLRRATVTQDARAAEALAEWGEQRSATWKELRPADAVPRVTEWLLCGPWTARTGTELLQEPPFKPGKVLRAAAGDAGPDLKKWQRIRLKADGWDDLDAVTLRPADQSLWALATWLENTGAESAGALLWFAFEDGWSVWLDGEEVSRSLRIGSPIVEDTAVSVRLAPGRHLLLVLLEDNGGAAAFSCRVSTPDGSAQPPGVRAGVPAG